MAIQITVNISDTKVSKTLVSDRGNLGRVIYDTTNQVVTTTYSTEAEDFSHTVRLVRRAGAGAHVWFNDQVMWLAGVLDGK